MTEVTDKRVRAAAKRAGLKAIKSRVRNPHLDNQGGYMLVDPETGAPIYGWKYELAAEGAVDICNDLCKPKAGAEVG